MLGSAGADGRMPLMVTSQDAKSGASRANQKTNRTTLICGSADQSGKLARAAKTKKKDTRTNKKYKKERNETKQNGGTIFLWKYSICITFSFCNIALDWDIRVRLFQPQAVLCAYWLSSVIILGNCTTYD